MVINGKTGGLSLLATFLLLSHTCAQEGGPQIGCAIDDLTAFLRKGHSESLPSLVRDCYKRRPANGSVDTIAYCFALDYSANQVDQAIAREIGCGTPDVSQ